MDRTRADHIGMLATTMNAICLKSALKEIGVKATVMSSINLEFTSNYNTDKALELIKDEIIILAGGLGIPCLSTDTTAAIRGSELMVDYILKGTNVDGIYDSDPRTNLNATKYNRLSYNEAINKKLKIMDISAFEICQKNNIKIVVYDASDINNIVKVCNGEAIGTIVNNYE